MENQPLLSLCIPTNGAVEWILPAIESIYSQGYDNDKFEVVITDNGKDSKLPEHIAKMSYPNLRYKQTTDEGFLNLVSCLKEGHGMFCKMINHRSLLVDGAIEKMVELIDKYKEKEPIIYCSSGHIRKPEIVECHNADDLVKNLSYWCSWSAGIGFWKKDIKHIDEVELNEMFPNASLLFNIRKDAQYVIWNYPYQKMEDDAGKGGYNLFETFGVNFINIMDNLRKEGRITDQTFRFVKNDNYKKLCWLYYSEVIQTSNHTFILDNIKDSMKVHYGLCKYWQMVILGYLRLLLSKVRN